MGQVLFLDSMGDSFGSSDPFQKKKHHWFNYKNYYKVNIYSYYTNSIGILPEKFHDLRVWLQEHTEGEVLVKHQIIHSFNEADLYFQHESDATMFKLTWGEELGKHHGPR